MSSSLPKFLIALAALIIVAFIWSKPNDTRQKAGVAIPETSPEPAQLPTAAQSGILPVTSTAPSPAPAPAALPKPLFAAPSITGGRPLPRGGYSAASSTNTAGRTAVVDRASFADLRRLVAGETVSLPLLDGRVFDGKVNLVTRDQTPRVRVGGQLSDGSGTFFFASGQGQINGMVLLNRERVAYQFEEQKDGKLWVMEKRRSDVVCDPLPPEPGVAFAPHEGPAEVVPILNSRPGAKEVIYLDFDGETVTDPSWNGGVTIVAASPNLSNATISAIFDRVKEDWYPFNINVTTDVTNYNAAPIGHRMRAIITPTNTAAPGAGGVAYLTSFRNGGNSFSNNIPCWVFNSSVIGISEAISHEVGHTMGLSHDGRELPTTGHEEYFLGQGSGATGWCPIMGAGYYKNVVQWSKGEYQYANNHEDDVAVISASYNHFGYMVDDTGNNRASAAALSGDSATGVVNQSGLIERAGDTDFYTFFTNGGLATINVADPSSSPDLDAAIELQDANGIVIKSDNPAAALNASVSATLTSGQYYVKVSASGAGDPLVNGYSSYASLGQYVITGTVKNLTESPIVTSAATASGQVGVSFGYRIRATGNPSSFGVEGALPSGLTLDSTTGLIVGYPTQAGSFAVTISASNASGAGTRLITIVIADASLTLGEALDFPALNWTTSITAPWLGQKTVSFDGQDAAQAAVVGDNGETSFSTTVSGPLTLEFRWKVSSEENGDFLTLQIDGADVTSISGVVDWTLVSLPVDSGEHLLTWIYRKNSAISQDPDTGYVDAVNILSSERPAVNSPANAGATVGQSFSYQIVASNTPSTFAIASGVLPLGLVLDGSTGTISGVPAAATSTMVMLTASNNVGASDLYPLTVDVVASPVSLAEAADDATAGAYNLSADPTSAAKWFPESAVTHDGVDGLQSGPIGPGENTSIIKTFSGARTINFWWKVESKPPGNRVRFMIDGLDKTEALNGISEWENVSVPVSTGSHTAEWIFERDASGSLGADAAWLDQIVFTTAVLPMITSEDSAAGTQNSFFNYQIVATNSATSYSATGLPAGLQIDARNGLISGVPTGGGIYDIVVSAANAAGSSTKAVRITLAFAPVTLTQALDEPSLTWTTGASNPWFSQFSVSYDGLHSARSGALPNYGQSYLETHVSGPSTVQFRWTVDSEKNRDLLRFYVDGALQDQISGPLAPEGGVAIWELRSYTLGAGDHTLRWIYSKDATTSSGRDAAWLDTVSVSRPTTRPVVTSSLASTAFLGRPFRYQITATNGPISYEANGLPTELSVDLATGLISGAMHSAGVINIRISAGNASGKGETVLLVLTVAPEPPGADQLANATALSGAAVSVEGSTAFATAEAGEPTHVGRAPHTSIWYAWTAPLTGLANINTQGSDFDTVLSVYLGTKYSDLILQAENGNAGKLLTSAVSIEVVAGKTYLIAVDSVGDAPGRVVLTISYAATGVYAGLLKDVNVVQSPGLASISLSSKFAFTGSLQLEGKKIPFKGAFVGEDFSGDIARGKGIAPAKLTLHIDLSPGAEEITGSLLADGVNYSLFAKLALGKADVPLNLVGAFTFSIEPDDTTTASIPRGIGYGSASIDKSGKIKVSGVLGDGSRFSAGSVLAIDHSWLLFLSPYKAGGVCAGEVLIDAGALIPPLSATLDWKRAGDVRAKLFTAGFGPTTATLKGYRYLKPAKDQRLLKLDSTTQKLKLSFGASDLPNALADATAVLETTNKTSNLSAGLKCRFVTSSGLFSGSATDGAGVARLFGGTVLQASGVPQPAAQPSLEDAGAGLYFGGTVTGSVVLSPVRP